MERKMEGDGERERWREGEEVEGERDGVREVKGEREERGREGKEREGEQNGIKEVKGEREEK